MSFRKISAAILAVIMCFSVHLGCAFADEGIEGETVAVIGDRAFSSLQDAFDALSGMPARRGADADSENECIVLKEDSVQNSQMVLKNCSGTLDLNGYRIYNTVPIYDEDQGILSLISVQDYAKLNIIDSNSSGHNNGGIFALPVDCYAVDVRNGGILKIYGGQFVGNQMAVYADGEGSGAFLYGGDYSIRQTANSGEYDYRLTLYAKDYAQLNAYGGRYFRFNPADSFMHDYFLGDKCAVKREGTWYRVYQPRPHLDNLDASGVCLDCGFVPGENVNYTPPVGEIIGVAFEDIGYNWHYHAYVGDGNTNYQEDIHWDYEGAIDYSKVRVDYPITVNNQTGRDLMSGTLRDDEALLVTLTTGSGSYTVKKPPHPESESNDTINQVKTLMWEGLLTIESDNGYPAATDGTLRIEIADEATLVLPSGTLTVGESAFEGDTSIAAAVIPSGCQSIGKWAFRNCTNLESIHIPADCAIEEGAFDGCGSVNVYSTADSPAAEYCRTHTDCTLIAQ